MFLIKVAQRSLTHNANLNGLHFEACFKVFKQVPTHVRYVKKTNEIGMHLERFVEGSDLTVTYYNQHLCNI